MAMNKAEEAELLGHGLAQGKQRLFEADQKQGKTEHHIYDTDHGAAHMGQALAQHKRLKPDQHDDNGRHVN